MSIKERTINATVENIPEVTAFVDEQLEALDCPMKAQMQIDIAIDELFGNIAHYAYDPEVDPPPCGWRWRKTPWPSSSPSLTTACPMIRSAPRPHITLSAEERSIGGLGIYMVKKSMDEISEAVTACLEELKTEPKNLLRIRLVREDILLDWQAHFTQQAACRVKIGKRFGRPFIQLELEGEAYDPLEEDTEEYGAYRSRLLANMGLPPCIPMKTDKTRSLSS